jgi:hypothetical protein
MRPTPTVRAITALTAAAGLVCGGTAAAAQTTATAFPHCYGDPGRGSYTQTGTLPGVGRAVWTFSVNIDANDNCVDTGLAEMTVTVGARRNAGPATVTTTVGNVQFTTDRRHWTDLPAKPLSCGGGVCLYHDFNAHVGEHKKIRQVRQTSYLLHNSTRSKPVIFTCDLDSGKCSTTGTAQPGNGCFDSQLCLYPQPDWNGQALVLNPQDIVNRGKCFRRTVRSVIDNDFSMSSEGQADGTSKSYVTHLRLYDNPTCDDKAPHRSKVVEPASSDRDLTTGGPTGTVQSFQLIREELTNGPRH